MRAVVAWWGCEEVLWAIFDAVDGETIVTTGDIGPIILLGITGRGLRGAGERAAWLRLVCRCAPDRDLRGRFDVDEQAEGCEGAPGASPSILIASTVLEQADAREAL